MDFAGIPTILLAAEGDKRTAVPLAVLIILPLFLTFLLYRFAKSKVDRGASRLTLWAALVPLVAGIALGLGPLQDILTPSYRDFHMVTPRSAMLHYAAFIVPCVATLLTVGFILYGNYREKMEQ
jgi:hypothetical protein